MRFVNKEITPFGGLSLFSKMFEKCHFEEHVTQGGVPLQGSNHGYDPIQLILGLFTGVWCGTNYFGHLGMVRHSTALCDLPGWRRGTDHHTYQRCLNKFPQAINQHVFGNLFRWFPSELKLDNYTLSFGSTMMTYKGDQEGAAKGYSPKRPGRLSYRPSLAFVSDVRMIVNYWPHPGNTSASINYLLFLENTFSIPEGKRVELVRMDNGFFAKEILDYLEDKGLHCIIACRLSNRIKYSLTYERKWIELTDGSEISETIYQTSSWEKPRRIVMVRQETERRPKAVGEQIKQMDLFGDEEDFGEYRYNCFVADLGLSAKIVYDSHRGRADSENRIEELKNDFFIDGFVTYNFWATEAYGNFIVMTYSFVSLLRHALINSNKKEFLKTVRYELSLTPAYSGRTKDKYILYLARSLKTRQSFLSIREKLKDFSLPYDTEKS